MPSLRVRALSRKPRRRAAPKRQAVAHQSQWWASWLEMLMDLATGTGGRPPIDYQVWLKHTGDRAPSPEPV